MELWHAWACPYCMRVRAAIAEKGIPYRSREIDLTAKPPDLLGRNPKGVLPVLIDGKDVVVGSLAILEHLCERWPEPPLFPHRVGRDAVVKAYERIDALFAPHLPRVLRGTPEERVQALGATRRAMAELDAEVPQAGFLLGQLSVADLALASFMAKLPADWRPTPLGFDRLARWERAVMRRPTVREQMGPQLAMVG
jgi:glutathione S-transferase